MHAVKNILRSAAPRRLLPQVTSNSIFARPFMTTFPAFRFQETEGAKIARENSRQDATHTDEIYDNDNVYRLSVRKVLPGTEESIKSYMEGAQRKIRRVEGLLEVEVLTNPEDPLTYYVLTHWKDNDHLNNWIDSDLCHEVRTSLDERLAEPVEVRTFRNFVEPTFTL